MARTAACLVLVASLAACGLAAPPAAAQGQPPAGQMPQGQPSGLRERIDDKARERETRRRELEELETSLRSGAQEREKLAREIAEIARDRARLSAELAETARSVQTFERRAVESEARLARLEDTQAALRASLEKRRGLIIEVIAALQRLGRRPPPAVLVRPEDILEAVRAAIVLGAVLPGLREEAQVLAADLAEMVRLADAVTAERKALREEIARLVPERERLAGLVTARQAALGESQESLREATRRNAELAERARSLRDLLSRLEKDIETGERTLGEARRAAETAAKEARERFAAAAGRDPTRLAPVKRFAEARGRLPSPVAGEVLRTYGDADGIGGVARGVSWRARRGAVVAAPADGWIAYAAPFRSYGQLLILDAGDGYHIVMAGLTRLDVQAGQFVLAGEPVGAMGDDNQLTSAAFGAGSSAPVLYVELRKDGAAIDPGPWWANARSEKVGG